MTTPINPQKPLFERVIAIKGGGDLATGIALTLYRAGLCRVYIMETQSPSVIRRKAAFATAIYEGKAAVEGVTAIRVETRDEICRAWEHRSIPVIPDPGWQTLAHVPADVLVDAVIAKKNLGTRIDDAPLVLGLGPGFTAPKDVDLVIETQRGHDLGRIISKGTALSNTSIPESVLGITSQRLVRAPGTGQFSSRVTIGARVKRDDILGEVTSPDSKTPVPVSSRIDGVVRGLIQDGFMVTKGQKIGDVDPRSNPDYCGTSSDKARALGGAVLTAILGRFNG